MNFKEVRQNRTEEFDECQKETIGLSKWRIY